jgi:hypothetical protein
MTLIRDGKRIIECDVCEKEFACVSMLDSDMRSPELVELVGGGFMGIGSDAPVNIAVVTFCSKACALKFYGDEGPAVHYSGEMLS